MRQWMLLQPKGDIRLVLIVQDTKGQVRVETRPPRCQRQPGYTNAQTLDAHREAMEQRDAVLEQKCKELVDQDFHEDNTVDTQGLNGVHAWISGIHASFVVPQPSHTSEQESWHLRTTREERMRNVDAKSAYAAALQRSAWQFSEEFIYTCSDCGAESFNDEHCQHCYMPLCLDCMFDEEKPQEFCAPPVPKDSSKLSGLCVHCLKDGCGRCERERTEESHEATPGRVVALVNQLASPHSFEPRAVARMQVTMPFARAARMRTGRGEKNT